MEIQRNLANILNTIRICRRQSLTEFADELEISRSHLQELLKQNANPRIDTVEHIAQKLGIDISVLISASFTDSQLQMIEYMLKLIEALSTLTPEKRRAFGKLFLEMLCLWYN